MGIVTKLVVGFFAFIFLATIAVEITVGIQTRDAGFAVLIVLQILVVAGILAFYGWWVRQVRTTVQYLTRPEELQNPPKP